VYEIKEGSIALDGGVFVEGLEEGVFEVGVVREVLEGWKGAVEHATREFGAGKVKASRRRSLRERVWASIHAKLSRIRKALRRWSTPFPSSACPTPSTTRSSRPGTGGP
jgi:hypothetical protein